MANVSTSDRRKRRLRFKIASNSARPRLSVFRSNKHIAVQLIDDAKGVTLASASTYEKDVAAALKKKNATIEAAKTVGKMIGERAAKEGVTSVVFERGPYRYHGRVKELADAARAAGLSF